MPVGVFGAVTFWAARSIGRRAMGSPSAILPLTVLFTKLGVSPYGSRQLEFVLRDPDLGHVYRHWWSLTPNSRTYPRTVREAEFLGLDPKLPGFDWAAFDTPLDMFGFPTLRTPLVGKHVRAQIDTRPRTYLKVFQLLPLDYEPESMGEGTA
ncbi:MAG: hypothetical protein ACYTGZ_03090 [Planctomycetota bacterium]|jgi:hypothetical protein